MAQHALSTIESSPEILFPLSPAQWHSALGLRKKLRTVPAAVLQERISALYDTIAPRVDCTQCGNCCKKLQPAVTGLEADVLAKLAAVDPVHFHEKYLSEGSRVHYMKSAPCMFLCGKTCSIYAQRPASCRDYPHLNNGLFKYKASVWEQYGLCPIVYHVIEALKSEYKDEA